MNMNMNRHLAGPHDRGRGTVQTIGGITWDPDYALDFALSSVQIHQFTGPDGSLRGFGIVSTINGDGPSRFCPGCELTFRFGGYIPLAANGSTTVYTGGHWQMFRHDGPSTIDPNDPTTMSDADTGLGELWLSLAGAVFNGGTLLSTVNAVSPPNLSVLGQLVVVGGLAAGVFATHRQVDGADLAFSASFTQSFPGEDISHLAGTGNFSGTSLRMVTDRKSER